MTRPIVFMTDYGLHDEFVGICRGVMLRIAPLARVIDLTHAIPRQDVTRGALVLSRATAYMPEDAVYCGVVDPGVGSERRAIAVRAASGALLVGPDNGLLSSAWDALGGAVAAHEVADPGVVLSPVSHTFHGRDVFAPGAAHLAVGTPLEQTGAAIPLDDLIRLELAGPMVTGHRVGTRVTGIDGFGNVQLDATGDHLRAAGIRDSVSLGGEVVPIVRIFADLPERGVGLIVDSQGFVAIVVNRGSAAEALQLTQGSSVVLEAPQDPGGDDHGERHLQPVD